MLLLVHGDVGDEAPVCQAVVPLRSWVLCGITHGLSLDSPGQRHTFKVLLTASRAFSGRGETQSMPGSGPSYNIDLFCNISIQQGKNIF